MANRQTFDIAIVGAGIAGAGAAFFLADEARVLVLEQEAHPGFHTTGRSAAVYTQAYGSAAIRALTVASKPFFDAPPAGFATAPILSPRGALFVARPDQMDKLEIEVRTAQAFAPAVHALTPEETVKLSPAIRPEYVAGGAYEPHASDIDVDLLLQGFLRGARQKGAVIQTGARVVDLAEQNAGWRIETSNGAYHAGIVVNAAGAWASHIGDMAGAARLTITPKRRTAFLFKQPDIEGFAASPLTIDVDENFYFKPDAGLTLGSPADETPVEPQDAQPEELDIAIGADRIQTAANLAIRRIERSWAGLRSFSADKSPVVGFDAAAPGFFWLAGQGGYGIQTAPALSEYAAALALGRQMAPALKQLGFDPDAIAPDRFMD